VRVTWLLGPALGVGLSKQTFFISPLEGAIATNCVNPWGNFEFTWLIVAYVFG
jgi:hypothetical protein